MHRKNRIEKVCKADAVRLGDKAEKRTVAIEAPRSALLDDGQARLVVAGQDFLRDASRGCAVDERQRIGPVPLHADDGDCAVRSEASDSRVGLEMLKLHRAQRDSAGILSAARAEPAVTRGDGGGTH